LTGQRVLLHIGAMKTGTTFVQQRLMKNRARLSDLGVLYPSPWSDQVAAVRDVLGMAGGYHEAVLDGAWRRLVDRVHTWQGTDVVVSMEFLSLADDDQVSRVVDDLRPSDVRVVLGARDLARGLPAQWQTSIRNGRTWTYQTYLDEVTGRAPSAARRHFWRRQDVARIVDRWAGSVGVDHITLVTVPPRGSDPALLWSRMAEALDLQGVELDAATPSNESLGPGATELLRRVNLAAETMDMPTWVYQQAVNRDLSHGVLPALPERHPPMGVPSRYHKWLLRQTERLVSEIGSSGVQVLGSLDDLQPVLDASAQGVWPEQLPVEDLLETAVGALTGYALETGKRQRAQRRRGGGQGGDPSTAGTGPAAVGDGGGETDG
jgi:hypothetical protein